MIDSIGLDRNDFFKSKVKKSSTNSLERWSSGDSTRCHRWRSGSIERKILSDRWLTMNTPRSSSSHRLTLVHLLFAESHYPGLSLYDLLVVIRGDLDMKEEDKKILVWDIIKRFFLSIILLFFSFVSTQIQRFVYASCPKFVNLSISNLNLIF